MSGVYIIAEAGVNHNGELDKALALVDVAAEAGADAVKFQTFKAESVVSADAPKAEYQKSTTDVAESQLDMIRRLELNKDQHHRLMTRCKERGIDFLSTPFDHDSLRFLVDEMKLKTLKIPSGEITNGPLLLAAASSGAKIICSTGMSSMEEVADALGVFAFGYAMPGKPPSRDAFGQAFASAAGKTALKENVALLHCTTEYPAPFEDINLRAMDALAETFDLPVGLSDHSAGIAVAIAAAARGAAIIEKHFTLDRSLPGPDHKASLEPGELKEMITAIRHVTAALGDGVKQIRPSETANLSIARKSLFAAKDIRKGEIITADHLTAMRPGTGVSPMEYWRHINKPAECDIAEGEMIQSARKKN
ncbi:MAG: N-acetylneuraminate synthase [Rhodospirillales bacterium RIFCSPLOWO2_12_FULL_58_28]|nr:MAG: N-acetylneuraminate synthase [Rhodospirillales bacterium RIFCSPLOWO2_02_FULL_58_16]OHC76733.1 MAG: N-acetylneuraminate synthase [Rhodospirillales bacterium RIFCSPLOWO2_12_FULL_58_28]